MPPLFSLASPSLKENLSSSQTLLKININGKRKKKGVYSSKYIGLGEKVTGDGVWTHFCSLQDLSLSPVILNSEFKCFTLILKFFNVRLA